MKMVTDAISLDMGKIGPQNTAVSVGFMLHFQENLKYRGVTESEHKNRHFKLIWADWDSQHPLQSKWQHVLQSVTQRKYNTRRTSLEAFPFGFNPSLGGAEEATSCSWILR